MGFTEASGLYVHTCVRAASFRFFQVHLLSGAPPVFIFTAQEALKILKICSVGHVMLFFVATEISASFLEQLLSIFENPRQF